MTPSTIRGNCACGNRTRQKGPDGGWICNTCRTSNGEPTIPVSTPVAVPVANTEILVPDPAPVENPVPVLNGSAPVAPVQKVRRKVTIDNPFREGSAKYVYFEALRDGKFHPYEELLKTFKLPKLDTRTQLSQAKDVIWWLMDSGRKSNTFVVTKNADGAKMGKI